MCGGQVILNSELSFPLAGRGKVRDIYDLGDSLLFLATDRISAFDCILPTGIRHKGCVLTQMSVFWFDLLKGIVPSHLITANVEEFPAELQAHREQVQGRSMIVRKARMIPVECVARGYLAGSGWKEYRENRTVCGIPLPQGLQNGSKLPEPIFTPATKAETGHDENVSLAAVENSIGSDLAHRLRDLTLSIYKRAAEHALANGIILADTKFEFGFIGDELVLADEVLTPDSSRYWPADTYKPGASQFSFDKQYVRDYLETLDWDKRPPAPAIPDSVAQKTSEKYLEAYKRITGTELLVQA